ncbi:MAG: helix-turn-helix domain-containing protein [Butyrivibrio sp.]|nr:helix-turn-helix domain-containing protein [Butyrivibrio sp.]
MKTNELYEKLQNNVIYRSIPIPFCNIEKGIKLIAPSLYQDEAGTLFVGNLEDFMAPGIKRTLITDCTYIICCRDIFPEISDHNSNVNLIFLDVSLQTAIELLTSIIKEKINSTALDTPKMYNDFWNDILNCKISTQAQVIQRLKEFPYTLKKHIACIIVRPEHKQSASQVTKITKALKDFFKNTNLFFTEEEWIILYSQDKDTSDELDIDYRELSSILEKYGLNAGFSYVCQLPELLRTLFLTADAALELGTGMSITPYISRIYTYHQYNLYYIIHLCAQAYSASHKTDNLIYLTHPDITRLYYYDEKNGNNLLMVMFEYLLSGQNTNIAAKALYMHRNTVINKLNKIEEVLGHKLDYEKDHYLFLVSCMIMDYQHNYTRNNISRYFNLHDFRLENE